MIWNFVGGDTQIADVPGGCVVRCPGSMVFVPDVSAQDIQNQNDKTIRFTEEEAHLALNALSLSALDRVLNGQGEQLRYSLIEKLRRMLKC